MVSAAKRNSPVKSSTSRNERLSKRSAASKPTWASLIPQKQKDKKPAAVKKEAKESATNKPPPKQRGRKRAVPNETRINVEEALAEPREKTIAGAIGSTSPLKIREQQTTVKTVLVRPKTGGAPVKMLMQTSSMAKQFGPPGAVFHPSMMRGIRMPSMGLMNGGGGSPLKPPFPMAARILSVGQSQQSPVRPVSANPNPSPLRKSVNSPTKSSAVSSSRFGPVDANSTSNELRQLIASLRAENSRLNDSLRREKASHDSLVSQLKSAHNSQIAAKDNLIAGRDTRIDELRQQVEMLHRDLANSNNERLRLINASEQ